MKEPLKHRLATAIACKCLGCPASKKEEGCTEKWCPLFDVRKWAVWRTNQKEADDAVQES